MGIGGCGETEGDPQTLEVVGASVPIRIAGEDDGSGEAEPHWWHDPRNAEVAVRRIESVLNAAAPASRAAFARNARAYLAQLTALDAGIATRTKPSEHRYG